ncbi:hypothetical protein OEZ85_003724 [Tetradesmus obliquus]|uniref:Uncharacterized protein n=1 Tax=Tetradesmus obliquus TaxID=3088 RepID=A0ABY8UDD8_TETOB|nr:hypothetical protein OEZ85_003724 [Tetradesmus obliquus]
MAQLGTYAQPGKLQTLLLLLALCLCVALRGATAATAQANNRRLLQEQDSASDSAKKAAAFCKSPHIKKLRCGWATQEEQSATISNSACPFCGTIWGGEIEQSKLPYTFEAFSGSYYRSPRIVSLACRPGALVTRVVYKMLTVPKDGYDGPILGTHGLGDAIPGKNGTYTFTYVSPVRRCDLQLPTHDTKAAKGQTSKSEADAALRSKEVNCQGSEDFGQLKPGRWYSDTLTFDFSGCSPVTKPKAQYWPIMPYVVRNPGPSFLLAKFEVKELW